MSEHLSFSKATQSIGLLSYTFLRKTGQDDVIVPMVVLPTLTFNFLFKAQVWSVCLMFLMF
jgi:hypothetical protein